MTTQAPSPHDIKKTCGSRLLAEVGTLQMEFSYLSHVTGDMKYHNAAKEIIKKIGRSTQRYEGLYPTAFDVRDINPTGM